jgi:phosphinothricin acetyltransferase
MKLRIASPEDLKAMVDIYNQAISAGQKTADITPVTSADRKQWFDEHTPDKYPILVAEKGESIVGYLTISAYRPGRAALRHTAEVSYFIHFEHHRQGIASRLLQHAIDMCPSLQIKTLFAILIDSNTASIRQLEKHGFVKWGHMPRVAEFDGVEVGHLYYGLRVETSLKPVNCGPG